MNRRKYTGNKVHKVFLYKGSYNKYDYRLPIFVYQLFSQISTATLV